MKNRHFLVNQSITITIAPQKNEPIAIGQKIPNRQSIGDWAIDLAVNYQLIGSQLPSVIPNRRLFKLNVWPAIKNILSKKIE